MPPHLVAGPASAPDGPSRWVQPVAFGGGFWAGPGGPKPLTQRPAKPRPPSFHPTPASHRATAHIQGSAVQAGPGSRPPRPPGRQAGPGGAAVREVRGPSEPTRAGPWLGGRGAGTGRRVLDLRRPGLFGNTAPARWVTVLTGDGPERGEAGDSGGAPAPQPGGVLYSAGPSRRFLVPASHLLAGS